MMENLAVTWEAFMALVTSPFIFFVLVAIAAGMTVAHFCDENKK